MASANTTLQHARDTLRNLQQVRSKLLRIFYREGALIAGSYGELFIRCGKPTCRCHADGGHFATRLAQWVGETLKTKIVRVADREWVKQGSDHYKSHKAALREVKILQTKELMLLKRIVELKTTKYE